MIKKKNQPKEQEEKISRSYPAKECANKSSCISGGIFRPHDRRQIYCCNKCGENYRNDLRHKANKTEFAHEKELRSIDAKLEKMFNRYQKGMEAIVSVHIFEYEMIDIGKMVFEQHHCIDNNTVRWFYRYGLGPYKEDYEYIKIYKKITNE